MNKKQFPSRVKIGNTVIGEGAPTFFIAEVGNNHNGDYYLAKRTIERAIEAGANAIKLQKRFIDEVFAKELREKPQTKDQVFGKTYGEYRRALELNMDEFVQLKKFCDAAGVVFFATPFDVKSADFLEEVGVPAYKIASFDVTNIPLLEYVAKKGKPMILSTGLSTLEEVDDAVHAILAHNTQLVILHCVGAYPTPDEKLNLMSIPFLQERYAPLPVGYSGHERDVLPSLAAITLGARCVERHITLDKDLPGPDHATVSLEPEEFREMVQSARRIERALGNKGKQFLEEEAQVRQKHTKSIVAKIAIPKGAVIAADMIAFKSPGYGLKPKMAKAIIGKRMKTDIAADTVMTNDHIVWEA